MTERGKDAKGLLKPIGPLPSPLDVVAEPLPVKSAGPIMTAGIS
jgi:hypothetical protein